jgi:hypothetical protein
MAKEKETELIQLVTGNGQKPIEVTPLQLLGFILKCVLKDRITDEEIEKICTTYQKTIEDWWG